MSTGERSCKPIRDAQGRCPNYKAGEQGCNVDCPSYRWDGVTKPDSTSRKDIVTIRLKAKASCKHCYGRGYDSTTTKPDGRVVRNLCRCLRPVTEIDAENIKKQGIKKELMIYTEVEANEISKDTQH